MEATEIKTEQDLSKRLSKCHAAPIMDIWGGDGEVATCHFECTECKQACEAIFFVKNQFGVWEAENPQGRKSKREEINERIGEGVTKLDAEMVKKLEQAFGYDCTVAEICIYCDISKQTYYNWRKENPKLFDYLDTLRAHPILRARKTVVDSLEGNVGVALGYLERKSKDEFSTKQIVRSEGDLTLNQPDPALDEVIKNATPEQREALMEAINAITKPKPEQG